MTAEEFLNLLGENGGAIVSSNECSLEEIEIARAEDRFYVDSATCFGYVWDPFEDEE
jgi:hypothetical protein